LTTIKKYGLLNDIRDDESILPTGMNKGVINFDNCWTPGGVGRFEEWQFHSARKFARLKERRQFIMCNTGRAEENKTENTEATENIGKTEKRAIANDAEIQVDDKIYSVDLIAKMHPSGPRFIHAHGGRGGGHCFMVGHTYLLNNCVSTH
jgi:hypothetical protein